MVEFRAEDHTYWENGTQLPGVTTILKSVGMIKAGNYYGTEARDRGTRVHQATELMDTIGMKAKDFDEEAYPYLKAWEWYLDYSKAEILLVETVVGGIEHGYAGTLDRIVRVDGKQYVLDIKTGAKAAWHPYQLAAYALATNLSILGGIVCYLSNTGKFNLQIVEKEKWALAMDKWKKILRTYQGVNHE